MGVDLNGASLRVSKQPTQPQAREMGTEWVWGGGGGVGGWNAVWREGGVWLWNRKVKR